MEKNTKFDNKKENNGGKNRIYIVLLVVFVIGLVVCLGMMGHNAWMEHKAQQKFEDLLPSESGSEKIEDTETEMAEETETEIDILEQLGITIPEKNLNWDDLYKTNEHIYAWIYIPNTNVDYPVLQHPTDDTYYLDYNLDGTKGYPGCIYSEHRYNSTDWTDFNTLLYGHNMKNGTMFRTLHNFEDRSFFEENRYIYIYTPEHVYVYDIFAAYANEAKHILVVYDNSTPAGRQQYLDDLFGIRSMSAHFRSDVEVTTDSNILTLVTCISGQPNQRYFVQGVLVNPVVETEVTE